MLNIPQYTPQMKKENLFFHYYPDKSPTFRRLDKLDSDTDLDLTAPTVNSSFTNNSSNQSTLKFKKSPNHYRIETDYPKRLSFKNADVLGSNKASLNVQANLSSTFKKKIRLEDRKQRSPYPDSRPKAISRGQYSICRIPSPSFIRSGVTGECKVSRLNATVNITQHGSKVINNNFYSREKIHLLSSSKQRSKSNCKNQKVEFYNNQHSCVILPSNQRLRRIVSTSSLRYPVHMIESEILSPMDFKVQFSLLGSQKYSSSSKLDCNLDVLPFSKISDLKVTQTSTFYGEDWRSNSMKEQALNFKEFQNLNDSFSVLTKLMEESSVITSQFLQNQKKLFSVTF